MSRDAIPILPKVPAVPGSFERAVDELIHRELEESPRWASLLGRDGFDGRLDDLSAAAHRRRHSADIEWLDRFGTFEPEQLTPDQATDRTLVTARLGMRVALADWQDWRRSPEEYLDTGITELFLLGMHSEEELTDAAVDRLGAIGGVLDEAVANLDPALASRLIVERGIAQCDACVTFARSEVPALAADRSHRARLEQAGEGAARAYEKFASFLRDLAPRCTGTFVLGEERYDAVLRQGELLDLDVRGLRERGATELERLTGELERAALALDASRPWHETLRRLQHDRAPSIERMRADYEACCLEARQFLLDQGLVTLPPDEHCHVVPAPAALRAILAVASYLSPPMFKSSRVGFFFVPYPVDAHDREEVDGLLESNAPYSVPTTSVHETYPGHHWHLMTMKEARPIRRIFTSTYFVEGWALYAEAMMRDAGFFTPEQELGHLEARLLRAARIVVDTSLHLGEMETDQAVSFMHERALLPLPTARSEVAAVLRVADPGLRVPDRSSGHRAGAGRVARRRRHARRVPRLPRALGGTPGAARGAGHRPARGGSVSGVDRPPPASPRDIRSRVQRTVAAAATLVLAGVVTGCSLVASPVPPTTGAPSLAPSGGIGYVVCPDAVTPVELATRTAEAPIRLPISGTPVLGDFAITTSPDGRWAYVETATSVAAPASAAPQGVQPATRTENVVVPIDVTSQKATAPIVLPGQGGTHAIAVMPGGRIVLAAVGSTVVPFDAVTRAVGTPLQLGAGHIVYGLALDPVDPTAYALVSGGVIPFDTARATAGTEIPTGLSVSSVYSPHGVVVSPDGSTVYALGQGGPDFGGRLVPIVAASGTTRAATSFDRFGITDPAAVAFAPDGSSLLVADAANDSIIPVPLAVPADPGPPVPVASRASDGDRRAIGHPTDVVEGSGRTGVFVVAGFDSVIPYAAAGGTFGRPIAVCSGATSMVVAPAP